MYRYSKPISLKLDNNQDSQKYIGVARAFLGSMVGMFGDDMVGCRQTRRLPDGAVITAFIPAQGMIPIVTIQTNPAVLDLSVSVSKSKSCYTGLMATPVSDDSPFGWTTPTDGVITVDPLGSVAAYGNPKVEAYFAKVNDDDPDYDIGDIKYNVQTDNQSSECDDLFGCNWLATWPWQNTWIDTEGKAYVWGGQWCMANRYAMTRYSTVGVDGEIHRCGKLLTTLLDGYLVYGVSVFEGYLYVVASRSVSFRPYDYSGIITIFRRPSRQEYTDDLPYAVDSNPFDESDPQDIITSEGGWQNLLEYQAPTIDETTTNSIWTSPMYPYGVAVASATTGKMAVCIGRGSGHQYILDPAGYLDITLGNVPAVSYIGPSAYPATTRNRSNSFDSSGSSTTTVQWVTHDPELGGSFGGATFWQDQDIIQDYTNIYSLSHGSAVALSLVCIVEYLGDELVFGTVTTTEPTRIQTDTYHRYLTEHTQFSYNTWQGYMPVEGPYTGGGTEGAPFGWNPGTAQGDTHGSLTLADTGFTITLNLPDSQVITLQEELPYSVTGDWNGSYSISIGGYPDPWDYIGHLDSEVSGSGILPPSNITTTLINAIDLRTGALVTEEHNLTVTRSYTRGLNSASVSENRSSYYSAESKGPNPHVFFGDSDSSSSSYGLSVHLLTGGTTLRRRIFAGESALSDELFTTGWNRLGGAIEDSSYYTTPFIDFSYLVSVIYGDHGYQHIFADTDFIIIPGRVTSSGARAGITVDHDGDIFIARNGFTMTDQGDSLFKALYDYSVPNTDTFTFYSRFPGGDVNTALGITGTNPMLRNVKLV